MNSPYSLREFLRLSKSGDVSPELRARLFGPVLAAISLLVAFGAAFTGGLIHAEPFARASQIVVFALLVTVWLLWKRGQINLAGNVLVFGMWFFVTLVVLSEGGNASHWLVPQFLLIILARFIVNGRTAIVLGLVTAALDFAVYQFDLHQYVPLRWRDLALGHDWVAIAISFTFVLFIFYLADRVLRESLRQAELTEGRYRTLFDRTNDAVFMVDRDYRLINVNQQAADLLGFRREDLIGKAYSDFVAPSEKEKVAQNFKQLDKEGTSPFFERVLVRQDGSRCRVEFNATAIRDENGKLLYYQGVARDMTERKRLEEQLRYSLEEMEALAMQDPLTGLLNRRAVTEHAEAEWHRSARERRPMCIVLIDLDNLKDVNDSLGHPVGDQAIIELAGIIKASRRRYDWSGRWGGDEFMLVLPGANLVEANEVAERLRTQYAESPVVMSIPERVRPHISIGVACYSGRPGEQTPLTQLISQADQALYRAKQEGKNRVELYRDAK